MRTIHKYLCHKYYTGLFVHIIICSTSDVITKMVAEVEQTTEGIPSFTEILLRRPGTERKHSGAVVVSDSPPSTGRLLQISNEI